MEIDHFSHEHPLRLAEDLKKDFYRCRGCKELIHDSSYRCVEDCEFYLHKSCAELPKEINHQFHLEHPLILQDVSPYIENGQLLCCDVCQKCKGNEEFVYHCSTCKFDLDIRCALLPKLILGDFPKLHHFGHPHPLLLIEKHYTDGKDQCCSACEEPISPDPIHCCFECGFYLHKKCAYLPLKINHPSHCKHSLTLLPSYPPHKPNCFCLLCKKISKGFVYCCDPCKFSIKSGYTLSDSKFEAETHEHPFYLFKKPMAFTCDACGIDSGENDMPCICTICNLVVHKHCIYLSRTIKLKRHDHPVFHSYFLREDLDKKRLCRICHDEVNMEYGTYRCFGCDYFVHVNCALDRGLHDIESDQTLEILSEELLCSYRVLREIKRGEEVIAVEIEHFSHNHPLILEEEIKDSGYYCDGCLRSISSTFYHCAKCKFFLHKDCAKLMRKKKHWANTFDRTLQFHHFFFCSWCWYNFSGFGYVCDGGVNRRKHIICIRCYEVPDYMVTEIHEHPLLWNFSSSIRSCSICDDKTWGWNCKEKCGFVLCNRCVILPPIAWCKHHLSEPHEDPLALKYRDDIHDPDNCYCDICEEPRDSNQWFYYCSNCDYSFHLNCALGRNPFLKLGTIIKLEIHQHPLAYVKEDFVRHICGVCNKRCKDVFLKCVVPECKYAFCIDCSWYQLSNFSMRKLGWTKDKNPIG